MKIEAITQNTKTYLLLEIIEPGIYQSTEDEREFIIISNDLRCYLNTSNNNMQKVRDSSWDETPLKKYEGKLTLSN